jgi:hypothetical protein
VSNGRECYPGFEMQVALGLVPGWEIYRKFGHNDSLSSGTFDLWPPGTVRVLPTTNTVAAVVSSSTADDSAAVGTGAWTIRIEGLDASGVETSDDVILDGQVSVDGTVVFSRINRAYVLTAGTGEVNAGNISISTDSGKLQAFIPAAQGQTQQLVFTIPSNKSGLFTSLSLGTGRSAGNVDFAVVISIKPAYPTAAWRDIGHIRLHEDIFANEVYVVVPSSTDVRVRTVGTSTADAFAIISGFLIANDSVALL